MINLIEDLDPVVEIAGLLFVNQNYELVKHDIISRLNDLGLDGDIFYEENFKVYEKYISVFNKNKKYNKMDDIFFDDYDFRFAMLIISFIIENREAIDSLSNITNNDINTKILYYYSDIYEEKLQNNNITQLGDIINFLKECKLTDEQKWKLMTIMNSSKEYYLKLGKIIKENKDAFDKAKKSIQKPLNKSIKQFIDNMKINSDGNKSKVVNLFSSNISVYPSLVFPISQIAYNKYGYYGLLSGITLDKGSGKHNTKESMIVKLKALSDQSKFQILLSLKNSPKYNLELAEELNLSCSTMSHHMNALLSCGLVEVTKREGKVYYSINKDSIKKFLHILEKELL